MTKTLKAKQPVVVLVGHIDHGKSSILEKIRDFKITEKETGGITQSIGAYEVEHKGKKITFIDTPGHEAFAAMRRRGAKIADIAILVVAVDDGVKPQTKEAISHLKEAGVSVIVAINKIDKPGLDPERIKDELSGLEIMAEDRGGDIPFVKTSAKTSKGIEELLEMILLVAEMNELKADIAGPAQGVIIESYLCSQRGCLATLLLTSGTIKKGDIVGTETAVAKVKRIEDFLGNEIESAGPGQGVLVLGFENLPTVGENFKAYSCLEEARVETEAKEQKRENGFEVVKPEEGQKVLHVVLKTDFLGSIEPIKEVFKKLPQEKVILCVLKSEAGDINLSDIKVAEVSRAVILGFRVKASSQILETAKRKGIKILTFDLIYDLVEGIRDSMKKMLVAERVRIDLGELKTLVIFKTDKKRQIVGAKVLEGEIKRGVKLEVIRGDDIIGNGKVIALQREKKELEKGVKGDEVGILFEGNTKIQEDDILKVYNEIRQGADL